MEYIIYIIIMICIYAILAMSLNLTVGFTGLSVLSQAAFFCVGAYSSALLTSKAGLSSGLSMCLGAVLAALLALLIGIPSIRVRGDYFALTTFGFSIVVYGIAKNWISLTHGSRGISGIPPFGIIGMSFNNKPAFLALAISVCAVVLLVINRIISSPFGRVLLSIRDDEIASAASGKDVSRYKIQILMVSGFIAGIAGSLYAHHLSVINPESFSVSESINILIMVVLGGMGSMSGAFIGATAIVVLPEAMRFFGLPSAVAAPLQQGIYGLLLVLVMLLRPSGIFGRYRWQ